MIAARLGGRRVPITGRQRGSAPDVAHKDLAIEVKTRRSLPGWIEDAMLQAEASSMFSPEGQLPIAILHQDGQSYDEALVITRLRDFEARFLKEGRLRAKFRPEAP